MFDLAPDKLRFKLAFEYLFLLNGSDKPNIKSLELYVTEEPETDDVK